MQPSSPSSRRTSAVPAALTLLLGLLPLLLLSWLLVPWDAVPRDLAPVDPRTLLDADQIELAEQHARRARVISWSSLAVSLLLLGWIALARRPRDWVARVPGPWWWQVAVATAGVLLTVRVLTLPWGLAMHGHRRDAGLTTQSRTAFLVDVGRSELVTIGVTTVVLLVLIGCARRWQRAWSLVAGLLLAGGVVVGSLVYPVVVEPLFHDFVPLPDGPLREEVTALADEMGTPLDDVLVADASRRTTTYNAWVSGLGPTRRVVLYDTLVTQVPPDEVHAVVAHELAHARHSDVLVGTMLGACGVLAATGLLALLTAGGVGGPSVPRRLAHASAVPVLLALITVGTELTAPFPNLVSRALETRADVEAVRATDDVEAFTQLQRTLSIGSRSDPTPPALSHWWWGSHPTLGMRVATARHAVAP